MVTTACPARPASPASAKPSTSCSARSGAELQPLVGQEGCVEIEFGVEGALDVFGPAEAVLLAIKQQKKKRDAPPAERLDHLLGLIRRDDPVLGALEKGHR